MTPEELLKEVGEPVAYYDPDLDCGSAGISFDPLSDGIGLYTPDQVAAAILKATKPLEDQLAKAEQRVAEWQPIETAPKDGTHILGWCAEFGARETKMNFYGEGSIGHANWKSGKGPRESGWDCTEPKNGWGLNWNPTHWMPLPKAPNGASS